MTPKSHITPAGAKDLLPLDVAQKRWVEEQLEQVFSRWGYHRIITSTVEHVDMLQAGGAIDLNTLVCLQANDSEALALRPELTASIARASATRLAAVPYPHRLYYHSNVFQRLSGKSEQQQESYQAGVELLGAGGNLADAEILLLLSESLEQLGLADWVIILGDAGLTTVLMQAFPEKWRPQIRKCLANLDRVRLEKLPLDRELHELALTLFDLRGEPTQVLQKINQIPFDAEGQAIIHNLKNFLELLWQVRPLPLILDLSLIQTINYYTGIIFQVTQGVKVLGQGGRYDHLLGLYHPQGTTYPSIGFCLNVESLQQAIAQTLPQITTTSDWLVVPESLGAGSAALQYAAKLRRTEHLVRVEIELEWRSPDAVRAYAISRCISHIAWIKADGQVTIETVSDQNHSRT